MSNKNGCDKSSAITGEEVVISGISGIFPNSDDVVEFMDNLYNKVDMVGNSKPRWVFKHPDLPKYVGTIKGMEKFDAQFFKVHYKQANVMDPVCRKIMEHVYGSVYDAGINPVSLKNTKIGIFMASAFTASESVIIYESVQNSGLTLPGIVKAMYANRVSYWIDSKGPSYATDLGNASALACLQRAYSSINAGECEAAIVGGANYCNHPSVSINLRRFGLLCLDGKTKCFDKNGEGYVRSDAVNVFFLQKAKNARRIYCEVYNVKGCYTVSPDRRFLPIREVDFITEYLESVYSSIGIDPDNVEYIECSSIGIPAADSRELDAIGKVYGRKSPIKVGSVTSNMGYSENASGMCSLTKLCLAYHKGQLPGNLHYNHPVDIPSIQDGSVQVLTDNTDFNRGFTALNSFSFTGTTYHALLKGHYKEKNNERYKSQIPYLILTSGRQEIWMERKINLLKCHPLDPELIGLLHGIYKTDTPAHVYRGYTILDADYRGRTFSLAKSVSYYNNTPGPVVFLYSGIGSTCPTLNLKLMNVPIFAESMKRSHKILESKGFDLLSLLTEEDTTTDTEFMNTMIGKSAMQIAFTDLLHKMGIVPDIVIGHSMGDIVCSYADGSLTAEQVLLSNYIRFKFWNSIPLAHGAIVAVGLGYEKLKKLCPPGIEVVCHNSPKSSTISGPDDVTRRFAEELKNCGIFVKELDCCNIPFHSTYLSYNESLLTKLLEEVIKDPKPRSSKWLSSSVPESLWNTPLAELSSAQYHSKNLLEPVFFMEAAKHIPENAIIIEISPDGQMQSILKQSHEEATYIALSKRGHNDPVIFLLEAIGELYKVGLNPDVSLLYPAIKYPVSTTTPLLSHFIEWEHSEDWPTNEYRAKKTITTKSQNFIISIKDDDYKYIQGNVRNGKMVFPEASLLLLVWNTLAMYHNIDYKKLSVVFDTVHFHDEVIIETKKILRLYVVICKGNDKFEVSFENKLVVSGIIRFNVNSVHAATSVSDTNEDIMLTKNDAYKLLHLRGYSYKGEFRSVQSTTFPVKHAKIVWIGEWATFLDSLIQLHILGRDHNNICILKYIHKITIDVDENTKIAVNNDDHITYCSAEFNRNDGVSRCAGVVMENVLFVDKPLLEDFNVLKGNINISYTGLPIHGSEHIGKYFDYSGISENLCRVMGVVYTSDENSSMMADPDLLWPVPEHWSLEEAVTVPIPYLYAFYCLTIKCNLHKHNSVLVTDGVNALGQAVISICLAIGCPIYTTVTNIEEKVFLMKLFPELQEGNIVNSVDGSFLNIIKYNTKGERCDVVISTFTGTLKHQAIECVKKFGFFLAINDYVNTQDIDLGMSCLNLDRSYKIVDLSSLLISNNFEEKKILQRSIGENIANGVVRPITRVFYNKQSVDSNISQLHLSTERQKGRVLLNLFDTYNQIDNTHERVDFETQGTYVIVCDESELGIELTEYLIKRGAKKIILHTIIDGFLQLKLKHWKRFDVSIEVYFENLLTRDGCEKLLKMRKKEIIEGIFIMNNCDLKSTIINKKYTADQVIQMTKILNNLNAVSKNVCMGLRHYVILSYASKGNFENNLISTCDMICEERCNSKLPALHYLTDFVDTFDLSNEIQLNINLKKIPHVLKDLEKSIKSKEIKINTWKIVNKSKPNFVNNGIEELNNPFNIGLGTFYKFIEEDECTGTEVLVNMTTKIRVVTENEQEFDSQEPYLLMIPGFDGNCRIFKLLCERLKMPALVLQLTPDLNYHDIKTVSIDIIKILKRQIEMKPKFYIFGYSFGVNVALELAALFEQEGHTGVVYCLDSSPDALRMQLRAYVGILSERELQDVCLNHIRFLFTKEAEDIKFENMDWSDKVKRLLENIKSIPFSNEYKKLVIETTYKKFALALDYEPDFKLESELILIKGILQTKATELADDYNLSKYTKRPIKIFGINSDFASAPEDCRIPDIVNRTLDPKLVEELKMRNLCETYLL